MRNSIEAGADNFRGLRTYLKQESNKTEQYVFGRLEIKDPKDPARSIPAPINDVMRGIQVSDSTPLEYDNLILTGKYERKPDGKLKYYQSSENVCSQVKLIYNDLEILFLPRQA